MVLVEDCSICKENPWALLFAYVTGLINQELVLKKRIPGGRESHPAGPFANWYEAIRSRKGHAGRNRQAPGKALSHVGCVAKPETILAWYRKLIAQNFDGSEHRRYPGRPPIETTWEALIVQMARENSVELRSNCGHAGQSRLHCLGSDCGERLEAAWYRAGAETQPKHD